MASSDAKRKKNMKQEEKSNQLKQFFTKKNIAIMSSVAAVCLAVGIAVPISVLLGQTIPASNQPSEISSYFETEPSSEEELEKTESIQSLADNSSQEELPESSEPIQEQPQTTVEQKASMEENTANIQPCTHLYTKNVIPATCSSQGYTVHTCQKCGSSYTDSYVAPRHDYGKYLCIYCDKPDLSMNPYYSLMAWMKKHQSYTNENGEYVWVYNNGNAAYKVTCNNMGSYYMIEYEGEEESLNVRFYNDADFVDSYYHLGAIPGRMLLSKETITIPSSSLFNSYPPEYGDFKYSFSNRLDDTFHVVQTQLLSPLGLNFHMFGFKLL